MKNLISRVLSAIAAILILFVVIYKFNVVGIYGLILFVVVRGSYELARMLFNKKFPHEAIYLFIITNTATFFLITQDSLKKFALLFLILGFFLSILYGVLFHRRFSNLDSILNFISLFCLGSIYTSIIPATVAWIVLRPVDGMNWFFCLLTVVFAGDIGAYLFGVTMGKNKIAPTLSPNKSLQGALGGLTFSLIAALGFSTILTDTPMWILIICGLFGGALGQIGDFFESLIKRVSGVKDSGSIMPGHGGVLDRLDGILMAAPLFYFAAYYHSL